MSIVTCARGEFWGERLKSHDVRGLTFTDYSYAPSMVVAAHRHAHAYVSLVLHGSYEEFLGGRTRMCTAGAVTWHPPEEMHRDDFGNRGTRIFTIEFDGGWLERVAPRLDEPAEVRAGEIVPLMRRACSELTRIDDLSPLVCEGLSLEILAELSRHARSRDARPPCWLERTRDAVASRFREKLTLDELAADAGVHPAHLVREFRRHYGTTVGAAIRVQRIELAARLLHTSDDPIAEIALDVGFSQQSHFTAAFRKVTGSTPARFRRTLRTR